MPKWYGSAGLSVNDNYQLLMVLQGQPDEPKRWTVPAGSVEEGESFEEACVRELEEETGYKVKVGSCIKVKKGQYKDISVNYEVRYYQVRIVGGKRMIQDPDELIYDIDWIDAGELQDLNLAYPEDRQFLLNYIEEQRTNETETLSE